MEEEIISNSTNSGKRNELNEALIKFNSVKHKVQNGGSSCCRGCLESIFPCLKNIDTTSTRYVFFADRVLHRLIISLIQFVFSLMFYYNAVALYNGMLILGYSTIYTNFPAVSVLLDRDTDLSNVMKFPALYKALLRGRELSTKNFLWWIFKSIFQAGVIMFGAIFLFEQNIYLKIVTVTFSVLIFVEILNVYTEIQKFHKVMIISLLGTGITYALTLWLFPEILDVYFIFTPDIIWRIAVIAVTCWLPFYLISLIKKWFFPEEYEKLNSASLR